MSHPALADSLQVFLDADDSALSNTQFAELCDRAQSKALHLLNEKKKRMVVQEEFSLQTLLEHNHRFVTKQQYEPFMTDAKPYKKLVIVTCMDTRLTALLPAALDLQNGDAKIIKVAGAMVAHPFGSVMRSIMVAVYALGAEHILVIGHHDCGMTGMDPKKVLAQARARGIPESTFQTLQAAGLDLDSWLSGFESVENSVRHSVQTIKNHPLFPFAAEARTPGVSPMGPLDGDTASATGRISPSLSHSESASPSPSPSPAPSASCQNSCTCGASSANLASLSVAPSAQAPAAFPSKISVTGLVICPTTGRLDLVTPAEGPIEQMVAKHKKEREQMEKEGKLPVVEKAAH